jgi:hypothetical protein
MDSRIKWPGGWYQWQTIMKGNRTMNWKFWKKEALDGSGGAKSANFPKPKELPESIGRKMVVEMELDPDMVWSLRCVTRPMENRQKTNEFRIFNPDKARLAGVTVRNWTSLDDWPDLILYSGCHDKSNNRVEIH